MLKLLLFCTFIHGTNPRIVEEINHKNSELKLKQHVDKINQSYKQLPEMITVFNIIAKDEDREKSMQLIKATTLQRNQIFEEYDILINLINDLQKYNFNYTIKNAEKFIKNMHDKDFFQNVCDFIFLKLDYKTIESSIDKMQHTAKLLKYFVYQQYLISEKYKDLVDGIIPELDMIMKNLQQRFAPTIEYHNNVSLINELSQYDENIRPIDIFASCRNAITSSISRGIYSSIDKSSSEEIKESKERHEIKNEAKTNYYALQELKKKEKQIIQQREAKEKQIIEEREADIKMLKNHKYQAISLCAIIITYSAIVRNITFDGFTNFSIITSSAILTCYNFVVIISLSGDNQTNLK